MLSTGFSLAFGSMFAKTYVMDICEKYLSNGSRTFPKKAHFFTKGGDFRISIFGLLALARPSIELIVRLICKPKMPHSFFKPYCWFSEYTVG